MMQYKNLGKTPLKISQIGFGCMSLSAANQQDDISCIRAAYDHGVNLFDTADLYGFGENEILVGKAVKPFRKDIILATKVGNKANTDLSGWTWDVSSAYLVEAINVSLKRLNTDYIDLYQIHGGTIEDNFEEVVETLESLKNQGKIRNYGISSIRPNVFQKYANHSAIVSNMMQYSILDNRPKEFFPLFEEKIISVLARGVLAQGVLVNKPVKSYLSHNKDSVALAQQQCLEIANKAGVSSAAIALHYALKQSVVASAIVGPRNLKQLQNLLSAYNEQQGLNINFKNLNIELFKYAEHR